jgi:hypothetical protein
MATRSAGNPHAAWCVQVRSSEFTPRRGGSDSTVTRTCWATGEALLVPARNRRSRVGRITGQTGKSAEGERVAAGSVVAVAWSRSGRAVRQIRRLRATWRGLETWHGPESRPAGAPILDPTWGTGGGRPPPATRWALSNERPYREQAGVRSDCRWSLQTGRAIRSFWSKLPLFRLALS